MVDNEMWSLPDGTILINVHPPERCEGTPCWIHHPTDHHMRDWPMIQAPSLGYGKVAYRICPHGVEHIDPDQDWFLKHIQHIDFTYNHICDGCCTNGEKT